LVRLCDNGKSVAPITVNAENAQVLICDERRRAELIQQRERLLALEAGNESKKEAAVPLALPKQETQSNSSAGTGNGIVAQNQSPATQQDPVYQRWESIGKAASWKPENHAESFGPWPEEYE
jgi:hypothetical protein